MKIATTIEQSKKLLELGIDPKTADMYYFQNIDSDYFPPDKEWYSQVAVKDGRFNLKYDIPAWSLSALLSLVPMCSLDKSLEGKYRCVYSYGSMNKWYSNPIDAAVEMVEWLVTNKHINNIKYDNRSDK